MNPPAPHDPAPDREPADDARLDQALRDATQAYLADDGFSTRVTAALPPRRGAFAGALTPSLRASLLLGAGLAGTAIALGAGARDLALLAGAAVEVCARWSALPIPGLEIPLGAVALTLLCLAPLFVTLHRLRLIPEIFRR